jgi:transcriptional regulator with GAF, ATPase, and Fis domain
MMFACARDTQAESVLSAARREAARTGDQAGMARIEIALADGAVARDNDARAHGHLATARHHLRPVPQSIAARGWIVEARLARAEGRPAPPWAGDDPDATQEELLDPSERMDLGAELSLERAVAARLARDWAGARVHLERARELSSSTSSPRLIALVEVEIGLYSAEVDEPGAAYDRIQQAIELLGEAGLKRDAARSMIRLAEMVSAKRLESARDSAPLWLGRAKAALGDAATWRDRSSIRSGFRALGRRVFDRVLTEETSSRIEGFERARGILLSAISVSVEAAECALNDLEAHVALSPPQDPVQALIDRVRDATLSMSSSIGPAVGEVDRVVHDLIDLIGAALVERDRLRNLVNALSDVDAATDRDALPPLVARVAARILEADHVVVALAKDGQLEPAGRWGSAPVESSDLWKPAATAVHGRGREPTPSSDPITRRADAQPAGPVLVVPMRAGDVDGVIYADKLTRKGQFLEQDHALAHLLAEYSAIALGRLRAREETLVELDRAQKLARHAGAAHARYGFPDVVGASPSFLHAVGIAKQAATNDSTVLLTGESGTGKEILAQAIHGSGARAVEPFIGLNVAALPREALEGELFGYERGALTGARTDSGLGKLELAGAGTLLLDEIGEMPLDVQARLLRVLQERAVVRLGGSTERPIQARVMATTRRDLTELVDDGKFRMDLLYRLRVSSIVLPPLRERTDDIALLAQHYLSKFAGEQRKRVAELGPQAREELARYDWPGNVRELANVIEAEVSLLPADTTVLARLATRLTGRFRGATPAKGVALKDANRDALRGANEELRNAPTIDDIPETEPAPFTSRSPVIPLVELEKKAYLHALEKCNQSVARAAEALGVSKVTFYAKLRAYGMHPKDRFDDEGPTSVRRHRVSDNPADPFEPPTRTATTAKVPTEK